MSDTAHPIAGLSALKLALLAKEVRAQAQQVLRADPIAIVGMACRVPGGGDTPQDFWRLLKDGVDAVREVPPERWDAATWFDADLSAPAKAATRHAGLLDRIDGFDADYFGVLPREAERMDPQQRLFLEVAMEALDDAGQTRERLAASRTGVFVASYHNDYAQLQYGDPASIDARTLTGTLHSVLANRLSYFLDLHGPSLSIDTACSSSLVAVHLACQSLRFGESDLAVAGGVSLIIAPELMVSMSKVGFMAVDGRCRTFDAEANGFGRGEGCGLVVLKRLSDAVADGDRVLAVVRGSAVNQDGHSTLLAAPHGPAQEALIREALDNAQLDAARIGYVEAHGTGTALGDPIEVEAITNVLGRVPGASRCLLGSAKANIGHLEAAAGVTGLIKAVLALRHEAVPPQVHFTRLSPHISLDGTRLEIPSTLTSWPRAGTPRCAAVSSFGVGGTNAHVIVEEAPRLPAMARGDARGARVLLLSGHSRAALDAVVRCWLRFLPGTSATLDDLCYTAACRRSALEHRVAVVASSKDDLATRLETWLREGQAAGVVAGRRPVHTAARLGMVFSGQGPQWFAMGRELMADEPVFQEALAKIDALLRPLAGWSLLEELARDEVASRLDQTEVAQPALFAVQVALAGLWRSWGVHADALVGHSVGEIAALHLAGSLDLETATRVAWHRGRLMQPATGLGRMASVGLGEAQARELLHAHAGRLDIAAINAPRSLVLSGESAALESALATLAVNGVSHRMLPVNYAFHSAQMAPFAEQFTQALRGLRGAAPQGHLYSTVTGQRVHDEPIDAVYFGRNVRQTVRFADAVAAMSADGCDVFLEIGPHPVLGSAIAECLAEAATTSQVDREAASTIVPSLRRGRGERDTLLQAAAALHVAGIAVDWAAVLGDGEVVDLPRYPWQHKRYWVRQAPARSNESGPAAADGVHPLLCRDVPAAGIPQRLFEGDSRSAAQWLVDHRLFGRLLLPAAAALEMLGVAAGRQWSGRDLDLYGFTMHRPLVLHEVTTDAGVAAETVRWQVVLEPRSDGGADLSLYSRDDGDPPTWHRIASAVARESGASPDVPASTLGDLVGPVTHVSAPDVYRRFAALGVQFGPTFQTLGDIERGPGAARAAVRLPTGVAAESARYGVHPVLIDAALQLCSIAAEPSADGQWPARVLLPLGVDRVRLHAAGGPVVAARAAIRPTVGSGAPASLCADVALSDATGRARIEFDGLRFAPATATAFATDAVPESTAPVYTIEWTAAASAAEAAPAPGDRWVVFADERGTADQLIARWRADGRHCLRVASGRDFVQHDTASWTLDPARPEHFERLLREVRGHPEGQGLGFVHAWALDLPTVAATDLRRLDVDDAHVLAGLLHLSQALATQSAGPSCRVRVLTRGAAVVSGDEAPDTLCPQAAGAWGLVSVIAAEQPHWSLRWIDLDPSAAALDADIAAVATDVLGDGPLRSARRAGTRWQARLRRHSLSSAAPGLERESEATPRQLIVARPGSFDGLAWQPMAPRPVTADAVRVRVMAAGLNFRDVLLALDMYPGGGVALGAECAGVVVDVGAAVRSLRVGDRVFGHASATLANEVVAPAHAMSRMPAGMNFETAAALPVAYLTAHHGLHALARLVPGERVLVHAAAGGVGMAAVQLALRHGVTVYATAGSPEKRERLRAMGVAGVMDSRTLAFADEVLQATDGEGVHVVLNSLAGEFIPASLRTLAPGGRFLELGKRDVWTAEAVTAVRADVHYHPYDLGSELAAHPALLPPMIDDLLAGLADGSLSPLPVTVFDMTSATDAMRHMAQARHIGKIVLRWPDAEAQPLVSSGASYWITGAFGGLGLETAGWLAARGARHLVLSGRREPDEAALVAIDRLRQAGAEVRVVMADAGDREAMRAVLDDIQRGPAPLRGVIHAAGTLHDGVLLNQRWSQSGAVLRGKAHGAWVLHELTQELPLDFFVLYSAAGLQLGASGQGLYPAANAQLDALAQARRRLGLTALSVAWGAWTGVGMAARQAAGGHDTWAARGLGAIQPAEGFSLLERLLREDLAHAVVMPIDWTRFLARRDLGGDEEFFAAVAPHTGAPPLVAATAPPQGSAAIRLKALPAAQRRDALMAHLAERTRHVLGLDADMSLDAGAALKDAGLDSLMAVELRNLLNRESPQALPVTLLFDYPTLDALADYLEGLWGLDGTEAPRRLTDGPARSAADDGVGIIAEMSDADAEAALLAELDRGSR